MAYAFDLKQACGGYAYFSTFTSGDAGKSIYEARTPSRVIGERFHAALAEIGQVAVQISSDKEYRSLAASARLGTCRRRLRKRSYATVAQEASVVSAD